MTGKHNSSLPPEQPPPPYIKDNLTIYDKDRDDIFRIVSTLERYVHSKRLTIFEMLKRWDEPMWHYGVIMAPNDLTKHIDALVNESDRLDKMIAEARIKKQELDTALNALEKAKHFVPREHR